MKSKSFGFGILFLCLDAKHSWQCLAWLSSPNSISQRPLRQRHGDSRLQPPRSPFLRSSYDGDLNHSNNTNNNNHSQEQQQQLPKKIPLRTSTSSFQTALCVIPPDESWDTLQRARHFAQDQTYHAWPPAIRLFHPFCPQNRLSEVAFDLAQIVEKYNIEPFDITLNHWTVMPLPSAMTAMLKNADEESGGNYDDPPPLEDDQHYLEVQALIASEERKGRERRKQREIMRKRRSKMKMAESATTTNTKEQKTSRKNSAPNNNGSTQTNDKRAETSSNGSDHISDEFNGPSMIALEPDEESSRRLKRLRELILRELVEDSYDPHAPASTQGDASVPDFKENDDEEYGQYAESSTAFRPLIPIGSYATIDEAITVARKLKGLWDPLTFSVTDLHFISQATSSQPQQHEREHNNIFDRSSAASDAQLPSMPIPMKKPTTSTTVKATPFGCDAVVVLMGEEIEMDNEIDEELANFVMREGTPGGYGRAPEDLAALSDEQNFPSEQDEPDDVREDEQQDVYELKLDAKAGDWRELVEWLDGDDDEDYLMDGTAMVFGRTHLFTGAKRSYLGMPASSTPEETDATFGFSTLRSGAGMDFEMNWEVPSSKSKQQPDSFAPDNW